MQVLHPVVKWAQRKDKIFLEIGLPDIKDERVDLTGSKMSFRGKSEKHDYESEVEFYGEIDSTGSKWVKNGFHMLIAIDKKEKGKGYWPRLTKDAHKSPYIQCDWNKWIDQEEEQEEGGKGLAGFDPNTMKSFNDSDDQEEKKVDLDDLEKEEPLP